MRAHISNVLLYCRLAWLPVTVGHASDAAATLCGVKIRRHAEVAAILCSCLKYVTGQATVLVLYGEPQLWRGVLRRTTKRFLYVENSLGPQETYYRHDFKTINVLLFVLYSYILYILHSTGHQKRKRRPEPGPMVYILLLLLLSQFVPIT